MDKLDVLNKCYDELEARINKAIRLKHWEDRNKAFQEIRAWAFEMKATTGENIPSLILPIRMEAERNR